MARPTFRHFISEHKDLLAADFALNPDSGMIGKEYPTLTYALRGLAYFELRVFGPSQDLHSGIYGGVVHNPANALAELISGMHDSKGRITLPGFYDRVQKLSKADREELARLPIDEKHFLEITGVPGSLWGSRFYRQRTHRGAPHPGCEWAAFRVYGRRLQDGYSRLGDGKDFDASGPRSGTPGSPQQLLQYLEETCPQGYPLGSDRHGRWTCLYFRP